MPHLHLATGTKLFYQIWRGGQAVDATDPNKPCVVLIHPCLSDSSAWKKQIQDPRLNNSYNFITFDSKFHGRSTGPLKQGFEYRDGAVDIVLAVDMLQLPPSHFVGESYGARRVVHIAVDRPDLVLSMMLISPGVFGEEPDDHQEPIRELRDEMMETNRLWQSGALPPSQCVFPREVSYGYLNYHFAETLDPETAEEEIERFNRAHAKQAPEVTAELLNAYLNKKPIQGLNRVTAPVLLLRGSRNTTEDPSIACELWKAAFVNSQKLEFHLIHGAPLRATAAFHSWSPGSWQAGFRKLLVASKFEAMHSSPACSGQRKILKDSLLMLFGVSTRWCCFILRTVTESFLNILRYSKRRYVGLSETNLYG